MWSDNEAQFAEAAQLLSSGSLTLTLNDSTVDNFVHLVGIGFSGSVTQVVVLNLISSTGAAYTMQLDSSSLSGVSKYVFKPNSPILVPAGWSLTLTCANSGTPAVTASAAMVYQRR